MFDGSHKPVEHVYVGDILLGENNSPNEVVGFDTHPLGGRQLFSINSGRSFITEDHPLMTADGWKSINPKMTSISSNMPIKPLEVGDVLLTEDGEVLVESITGHDADANIDVHNFIVNGNRSYYGDGHLVRAYADRKQAYILENEDNTSMADDLPLLLVKQTRFTIDIHGRMKCCEIELPVQMSEYMPPACLAHDYITHPS